MANSQSLLDLENIYAYDVAQIDAQVSHPAEKCSYFIEPPNWPPYSPDLNP